MLDWDRIRELRSEVGDDEFKLILELFLDEVEGVIMRLSTRNGANLATDLHFLKGCARNLGFSAFGVLCDKGERMAARGQSAAVSLEMVLNCYSESKRAMINELSDQFKMPEARQA